jgi:hypothetical protein
VLAIRRPSAARSGQYVLVATGEPLGSDDYESLQRASDELTRSGWRRVSLNDALGAWERFVENVETGYSMTIDDYTNDLSIRRWPEEARAFLTPRTAAWMDERLVIPDARFRDATTEASGRWPTVGDGWWVRRIPKVLVGELADDVSQMRLG